MPRSQDEAHEPPERWLEPIEQGVADAGAGIVRDFLADAARLLDPDGLLRSVALGGPLTLAQIADLKALIRQHYACHLAPDFRNAFWAIPEEQIARWRRLGIVGPTAAWELRQPIDDAVVAARLAEILDTGATYTTMLKLASERPLTRAQELARTVARDRLWVAIDALAWRHAEGVARLALEARQRSISEMVADFIGGTLTQHGRPVATTHGLAATMRERMKGIDVGRDWQRVAVSEVNWAFNYATLVHYLEQGAERVYYRVHPDACDDCKRVYLHPDGTPRVFLLDDVLAEIAAHGGTNIGIPRAGWRPTALLHPWCRCRPFRYLARFPFVS